MSIIEEIDFANDRFKKTYKETPAYIVLSKEGYKSLKSRLDEISGKKIYELKKYKGMDVIKTKRHDVLFILL